MKLNPAKCAFGVSSGKFLGFMVTQREIEINPDQVKAIANTLGPTNKKELQRLTGKLVALGRFIARFTDKMKPFFLTLKDANKSGWMRDCQNTFEEIKRYLSQPPILSSPQPGKKLYLYRLLLVGLLVRSFFAPYHPESKDLFISLARHLPTRK